MVLIRKVPIYGKILAGLLLAVVLGLSELFYTFLARKLTEFENHRLVRLIPLSLFFLTKFQVNTYEQHFVFKTFLFHFVSSSSAAYFVAFLKQSLSSLPLFMDLCEVCVSLKEREYIVV